MDTFNQKKKINKNTNFTLICPFRDNLSITVNASRNSDLALTAISHGFIKVDSTQQN